MNNQFIYPLKIHIEDTDCTGVVFHTNYLKFMERGRSEWLDQLGFGIPWQREHQVYFLVHSINIQFLKPVRVHEKVEVISSIKKLGKASVIFEQYLRLANSTDKILCKAEIKLACVNNNMQPCAIPNAPILRRLGER